MRGRRCHSRQVESVMSPKDMSGMRRSVNVFTPRIFAANSSVMYRLMPSTIETTAMRNITPIMTPISVKKLLSFCTLIWARARRTDSKKCTKGAEGAGGAKGAKAGRFGDYVNQLAIVSLAAGHAES